MTPKWLKVNTARKRPCNLLKAPFLSQFSPQNWQIRYHTKLPLKNRQTLIKTWPMSRQSNNKRQLGRQLDRDSWTICALCALPVLQVTWMKTPLWGSWSSCFKASTVNLSNIRSSKIHLFCRRKSQWVPQLTNWFVNFAKWAGSIRKSPIGLPKMAETLCTPKWIRWLRVCVSQCKPNWLSTIGWSLFWTRSGRVTPATTLQTTWISANFTCGFRSLSNEWSGSLWSQTSSKTWKAVQLVPPASPTCSMEAPQPNNSLVVFLKKFQHLFCRWFANGCWQAKSMTPLRSFLSKRISTSVMTNCGPKGTSWTTSWFPPFCRINWPTKFFRPEKPSTLSVAAVKSKTGF